MKVTLLKWKLDWWNNFL